MPEPVWVDMRDIGTTTQHGKQIADAAVGVRPAFATKDWPLDDRRPNSIQRVAHERVQRNCARFVALSLPDCRLPRAGEQRHVVPGEMDELVDAQPGVQERGDDCIWHRSGALGLTPKSLPFDRGETLTGRRLAGD